jgi:tetratricopeptide (TPR) repeat protein
MYSIALTGNGDYDRAFAIFTDGLAFAKKVGDEVYHLRIMNFLGWLYLEYGDFDLVVDVNRQPAQGARLRGDPETIANAELNLGDALMARGELSAAGEILGGVNRLAQLPTTSDWMKWRYTTHLFASMGELWLSRGDTARAQDWIQRCIQLATQSKSRKYLVKGWRLKAEIFLACRRQQEAEAALNEALRLAKLINNPTQLWKTHLAAGDLYNETGRPEEARNAFHAAGDVIDHVKDRLENEKLRRSLENLSLASVRGRAASVD